MFEKENYIMFSETDTEELEFYNKAKQLEGIHINPFTNGEYFTCLVDGKNFRFLHATFGENSWYEIYELRAMN